MIKEWIRGKLKRSFANEALDNELYCETAVHPQAHMGQPAIDALAKGDKRSVLNRSSALTADKR